MKCMVYHSRKSLQFEHKLRRICETCIHTTAGVHWCVCKSGKDFAIGSDPRH